MLSKKEVTKMTGTKYDSKHSFNDFGLIRTVLPVISSPITKKHILSNPCANGDIDISNVPTGFPVYETRTITEVFIIPGDKKRWDELISALYQHFDGSEMWIELDSDPWYKWLGIPMIKNIDKSADTYLKVEIQSIVKPFKYEKYSSVEDWLWDDFNFETGIIRDYRNIDTDGGITFEIIGTKMPTSIEITVNAEEGGLYLKYYDTVQGKEYDIDLVENPDTSEIILYEGINMLEFIGTGNISIDYRGGIL